MNNSPLIELRLVLESHRNIENAKFMTAYLKNHFCFLGIKKTELLPLYKQWIKINQPESNANFKQLVTQLWAQPEREFHHIALEILKKQWQLLDKNDLPWLKNIIEQNTWWDTVDIIASNTLGHFLKRENLQDEMDFWIQDSNFWIRRCALIFQLKYKENLDWERLVNYILLTMDEKEFFIRKAIGWSLRQHSRTDPHAVEQFVLSHPNLSGLSKREALRLIYQ